MKAMESAPALAPGIPVDYYRRIYDAEERHWWYAGMRNLTAAMLGDRLTRAETRLLDAGCGTGGFLRWALDRGSVTDVAGVDLAVSALELARTRVPEADLRPASLRSLPFDDEAFDLVVSHDVLQHVPEQDVAESLHELRRVLAPAGTLLARTNGARHLRRERDDWRAYDRQTLRQELVDAGFAIERVTYANSLLGAWGALRGRVPRAPSEQADGIPRREPGALVGAVGAAALGAEARYLSRPGRTLAYGHTLLAVARRG